MADVERVLEAYERDGEELVAQWTLRDISLEELQQLFGVTAPNPMCDVWLVERQHVRRLERAASTKIDLDRFEYYIGAYSTE